MYKYEITKRIESFAPLETQEEWDCSGWGVNVANGVAHTSSNNCEGVNIDTNVAHTLSNNHEGVNINGCDEIHRIMLCLTVTDDIIKQAKEQNCDMIVSHHPCFYIPLEWSCINIYSAHTNLDKAQGGTTDTLIESLGLSKYKISTEHDFLRVIDYKTTIENFNNLLKQISPNARLINNKNKTELNKIAFCAGSGSEFINDAKELGADCFVTGDLKFHTALDSEIVIYDIGHFESEILVLPVLAQIIGTETEIVYAKEKSPFSQI